MLAKLGSTVLSRATVCRREFRQLNLRALGEVRDQ
jgi:hypothetical protein